MGYLRCDLHVIMLFRVPFRKRRENVIVFCIWLRYAESPLFKSAFSKGL